MTKKVCLALFLFFFYQQAFASFLFEIEHDGKTSLLYGSAHFIPLDDLPHWLQQTLKKQDVLITENVETAQKKKFSKQDFKELGLLKQEDEPNWLEHLSAGEKTKLEEKLLPWLKEKVAPGEVTLEDLHLAALLEGYTQGCFLKGIDRTLLAHYNTVYGLETAQDIQKFLPEVTLEDLKGNLQNKAGLESPEALAFMEQYKKGNLDLLEEDAADDEIIIRNKKWLPKIIEFHKNLPGAKLFVVGYAHLKGLVNLLKEQGFKIWHFDIEGNKEAW